MMNFYWNKYVGDEYKSLNDYDKSILRSSMKFKDWLAIYSSTSLSLPENVLLKKSVFWRENSIDTCKEGHL